MAKIFISKSLTSDDQWAKTLINEGHVVIGSSCIQTQSIIVHQVPEADWTFFSSAQGVKHFLEQHPITTKFIGVMGEGTLKALKKFGHHADFIGQSSDPEVVGKAFMSQLKGEQKILFPASQISKQNIAKQITGHTILQLPCYQTFPIATKIEKQDLYIFTSPSNVDGFLLEQPLPDALFIAYGPTTGTYLTEKGVKNVVVMNQINDINLLNTIKEKVSG